MVSKEGLSIFGLSNKPISLLPAFEDGPEDWFGLRGLELGGRAEVIPITDFMMKALPAEFGFLRSVHGGGLS